MKMTTHSASLAETAGIFAALGSEQRLAVLRVLVRAGPDGLSIGDLGQRSGVSGSTLTHHMKLLSAAGLVVQVKDGRRIICMAANFDVVQKASVFLLRECCADASSQTEAHDHE